MNISVIFQTLLDTYLMTGKLLSLFHHYLLVLFSGQEISKCFLKLIKEICLQLQLGAHKITIIIFLVHTLLSKGKKIGH